MKAKNPEFEEFEFAEAVGLTFKSLDFVVHRFEGTRGDGVVIVSEDYLTVAL
jgi:hypothetical protein